MTTLSILAVCCVLNAFMLSVANKPVMLSAIMLNAIMLNAIMLNAIMLNGIMLNVIMLNAIIMRVVALTFQQTMDTKANHNT